MVKKKLQNRGNEHQIDRIPKVSQQPRSPAPKRRTDFSRFFNTSPPSASSSPSSVLHCRVSLLESPCSEGTPSGITVAALDDCMMWKIPQAQCSKFQDASQDSLLNSFEDPVVKGVPASQTDQALERNEHLSSCKQFSESLGGSRNSDQQQDQSSGSSKMENKALGTGKGKRIRKPKLHFDEATLPMRTKRSRRLRIMRYLGLTAPIGSPF